MPADPAVSNPLVRRILDTFNSHRPETFDALLTEDCVLVRNEAEARGREAIKRVIASLYRAFPDLVYEIDDAVAAGDKAAIRWRGRGTHRGEYLGVAPSGSSIEYFGITFLETRGDRIGRLWVSADLLGLLRSLSDAAQVQVRQGAASSL
jgi:steroid delta-isomerase-like uncharacterized protein